MDTTAEKVIFNDALPKNLWNTLDDLCNTECGNKGMTFIEGRDEDNRGIKTMKYNELRKDAQKKSFMLRFWDTILLAVVSTE